MSLAYDIHARRKALWVNIEIAAKEQRHAEALRRQEAIAARARRWQEIQDERRAETERALRRLSEKHPLPNGPKSQAKQIIAEVAARYGVTPADITGPDRRARCITPRHVAILEVWKLQTMSLPVIGRLFGGRDHTTILHAVRKMLALEARGKTENCSSSSHGGQPVSHAARVQDSKMLDARITALFRENSFQDMALALGVSEESVRYRAKRLGLRRRSPGTYGDAAGEQAPYGLREHSEFQTESRRASMALLAALRANHAPPVPKAPAPSRTPPTTMSGARIEYASACGSPAAQCANF